MKIKWEGLSLKSRSIFLFCSSVFSFLVYYSINFFLVRILDKHDYGVYQQYQLVLVTLQPIFSLGLSTSLFYFYPISDTRTKNTLIIQSTLLLIISSCLATSVLFFIPGLFELIFASPELSKYKYILFFSIMLFTTGSITDLLFIILNDNKMMTYFSPVEKLSQFAFVIPIAVYSKDLGHIFLFSVLYLMIKVLYVSFYIYNKHIKYGDFSLSRELLVKQLSYSTPFYAGILAFTISQKFDKIIVNRYVQPEEFALYTVAFLGVPLLTNLFSAINNVSMSQFVKEIAQNNLIATTHLYRKIVIASASIGIPIVFFAWIYAEPIINLLFTSKYSGAVDYYRLFLISIFALIFSHGLILRSMALTKYILYANIIGLLVTVITGIILIPKYGFIGGVITSLISIYIPIIFQILKESKLVTGGNLSLFPFVKLFQIMMIAIVMTPIPLLVSYYYQGAIITIPISFFLYFIPILIIQNRYELTPFRKEINYAISVLNRVMH